jgi:two-component system, chemotaxis family, sensor kinase CheA
MQAADIDLSIFRDGFFDEAREHVSDIEASLLLLEANRGDRELLNRIFRGAHSIKGGSATFGLTDLTRFTHALESLLDPLREGTIELDQALASLLFRSTDVLEELLAAAKSGAASDPRGEQVLRELQAAVQRVGVPTGPQSRVADALPALARVFRIVFAPHAEIFLQGMDPVFLLRNLCQLGAVSELLLEDADLPRLGELDPERCHLRWSLKLATDKTAAELLDVFAFVEGASRIDIEELAAPAPAPSEPALAAESLPVAPRARSGTAELPAPSTPNGSELERVAASPPSTLRVSTDKLDRLVNLVGELVIAQSMITQSLHDPSGASLARLGEAAVEMERNTRELQDLVMSVRMVPMGSVFNRFPRLARDLALACHKKIHLEIEGQETEIDKGVIEQLADPLTHLIRNSIDHGLETPEERLAAGKSETGTIHLSACHQGGSVILEVKDDGRGLNVERIHAKALALNLARPGDKLSEEQIYALILEPGFSTASTVTDLSGRGVGLDVVRRNIDALNGSLSITSEPGRGVRMRIRLPLTLAILDGLSLRVGTQVFVLPLLSIAESFRPTQEQLKSVLGRGEVVLVRGEPIPLVRLYQVLNITPEMTDPRHALVVIVETGSAKIGVLVDELLGQAQVVVKSLEAHYRKVEGLMGATILGDGRVALILDAEGLARRAFAETRAPGAPGEPPREPPARAALKSTEGQAAWNSPPE